MDTRDFCAAAAAEATDALAERQLAALAEYEPVVRAFVCYDVGAARQSLVQRNSGPLAGALVGVKDIICSADFPTGYGASDPGDAAPRRDAWCVGETRRRGGTVLGKTACTQFAYPIPGPTTNPHDAARTPGGSSSGSAAAVAAGFVSFALGTQTAGSIVRPASYCGVTGYKPTYGLLYTDGVQVISTTLDHVGVFARSPRDAWYFVSALVLHTGEVAAPRHPRRLLMLRLPPEIPHDDGYRERMAELAERLRWEGIDVTALDLPFALEDFTGLQRELCYWEAARILREPGPVPPVPRLQALLAPYRDMDIARYLSARVRRQAYQAEFSALAADYDAVLTPAATGAAPGVGDTGDAVMSRFWTALHVPAMSVPMWSSAEGLPLGLQLLGGLGRDRALAETAQWFFERREIGTKPMLAANAAIDRGQEMIMPRPTRRTALQGLLCGLVAAGPLSAQEQTAVLAAARKEGKVALATSVSAADFPRFLHAFAAKYPFIDATSGLYSAPTGRVLARVDAEMRARNLSFDVLHVASLAPFLALSRAARLLEYRSPELDAYPVEAHDRGEWATARIVGVIMAYNKNVLPPEQAPKAWVDLLRPAFKGRKLVVQDSAAGTSFNQMYLLEKRLGSDFMRRWGEQQPIIVATSAQLIDMLVRGEALLGATVDHFRAFEPQAIAAGIVGVYPSEGMPLATAPIAILKDAPHPNAARLFVDYVLSEEGQKLLATEIFGVYSMRRGMRTPAGQMPLADAKPLLPTDLADYEAAARNFPETFDRYFKS